MTPILIGIFGINPTTAVGSDLASSMATKPVGALVHHRARTIRWDVVKWLLPTAVPAAFSGAFLLPLLGDGPTLQARVKLAVGAALLLAVAGMLARAILTRRIEAHPVTGHPIVVRRVPTLLIGLTGGLIVGMTSVGSGSVIIVLVMLTYPRLTANELVGTDLAQAIPIVAAAAAGHLIVGDTHLGLTATILLGSIPAVYVGARLSTRAPSGVLRWVLAILLLGSGLALWHVPSLILISACGTLAAAALLANGIRRIRRIRSTTPKTAAKSMSARE